jgi:hypothetical protein
MSGAICGKRANPGCRFASKYGRIFKCSACDRRGWYGKAPPHPGGGKGDFYHICQKNTLHRIFYNCSGCEAVTFKRMTKRVRVK